MRGLPIKSLLIKTARIAVGIGLLAYVLYAANLFSDDGWQSLLKLVSSANLWWLIAALVFIPVMDMVSAIKWHFLTRQSGFTIGYWRLFVYYTVGRFFNMVLPSSIGGDVIRVHLLARTNKQYAKAAAVVFVERLTGVITLVVLAAVAVLFSLSAFHHRWLELAILAAFACLAIAIWFSLSDKPLAVLMKYLPSSNKFVNLGLKKAEKFKAALSYFHSDHHIVIKTFGYSGFFYLFAVFNVWITALTFAPEAGFLTMIIAVPIIMFIMNIPVSIGGIGIMEFAYTFTLTQLGYSSELAVAIALLMRLKSIIAAGIGAAIYPLVNSWGVTTEEILADVQPENATAGSSEKA